MCKICLHDMSIGLDNSFIVFQRFKNLLEIWKDDSYENTFIKFEETEPAEFYRLFCNCLNNLLFNIKFTTYYPLMQQWICYISNKWWDQFFISQLTYRFVCKLLSYQKIYPQFLIFSIVYLPFQLIKLSCQISFSLSVAMCLKH